MAQAVSLSATTSPMLSPKAAGHSNKTTAPCMASFPLRRQLPKLGLGRVRAQASGDNRDNSVEVQHVNKGDQGQGSAVERKPRRGSMDISPFGEFSSLFSSTPRILASNTFSHTLSFVC
jgi:HSP20 family protein